ncbi:hypothetical protein BRADI_4g34885v3 [Brachypodium distachyon]|uniref:Uncharacterized protein n=1 Tax=Brachypodium distachyon TaxID=15368 RepID=A0A2K2CSA0_BRADI|nr:hypothetical protein BRADI_4g34885v3 [Brachypodium distachyon]
MEPRRTRVCWSPSLFSQVVAVAVPEMGVRSWFWHKYTFYFFFVPESLVLLFGTWCLPVFSLLCVCLVHVHGLRYDTNGTCILSNFFLQC